MLSYFVEELKHGNGLKTIKKLKADYATFNIDSAVMIYGFNIENKTFKLLNFIVNCAMFIIYKV